MALDADTDFPPLPPYTHVPGVTPHPVSDPKGHLYGAEDFLTGWPDEKLLGWGGRLFEHGFYWEAHEAWEQLWIRFGRRGREADVVKGLIKLAACGVKCLETNQSGAIMHAKRATELLQGCSDSGLLTVSEFEFFIEMALSASLDPPVLKVRSRGDAIKIF